MIRFNFIKGNLYILAMLFLFGCGNEIKRDANSTILEGDIQFPSAEKLFFYSYADSIDFFLAKSTPVDSAVPDKNGHFIFKLKLENPSVFSLKYGNKILVSNLFILKGDHLIINFLSKNHIPKIEPLGMEAKFNIYLLQFVDTFYNETNRHNEYYIASNYMDIQQFRKYNEKRKKDMVEFYTDFFKEDSISSVYSNFAINTICYELASDRLMYLWKKRMKGDPQKPDSLFSMYSNESFVENEAAFSTPSYIRFMNLYLNDTYESLVEKGELPIIKGDSLRPSVDRFYLAQNLFSPRFRNAVLFNLLINDLSDVADTEISADTRITNLDSLTSVFKKKYSIK